MPRHSDFETIYQNFISQYGQEQGESYYYAWLKKNDLDDTKPYSVEEQYFKTHGMLESYQWVKPETVETFNREDPEGHYWRMGALTANLSMNKNDYRNVETLMRRAASLSWRPLNLDHDHSQWLPFPEYRIHYATFEDNVVETIIRVPKGSKVDREIESGAIVHPSIEGFPLEGYGRKIGDVYDPETYTFVGAALLHKGAQLPGDPLTTINPLTESYMTPITESLGHSLVESLKRGGKMKEQQPRSDAERAKAHFNLSDEQWNSLSDEEKQALIDKLPARGSAEMKEQETTVIEQPTCPNGQHYDKSLQKCVSDTIAEQDQTEQPEQSVTATEVPPEIPQCEPGQHWDPEQMKCVQDEVPGEVEPEQTGAKAFTPAQPPQTTPQPHEKLFKMFEAEYPWDQCIADQMKQYGDIEKAKKVCAAIKNRTIAHAMEFYNLNVKEAVEFVLKKINEDKLFAYNLKRYADKIQEQEVGDVLDEHGCVVGKEVWSEEQQQCVAKVTEQEGEKDEHGCLIGKEEWDGEKCVPKETVEEATKRYLRNMADLKKVQADQTKQLREKDDTIRDKNHKIESLETKVSQLQKELTDRIKALDEANEDKKRIAEGKGGAELQVISVGSQRDMYKLRSEELHEKLENEQLQHRQDVEKLTTTKQELRNELKTLEQQFDQFQKDSANNISEIKKQKNNEISELRRQIGELNIKHNSLKEAKQQVEADLEITKKEAGQFFEENERLTKEVNDVKIDRAEVYKKANKIDQEHKKMEKQLSESLKQIDELKNNCSKAEAKLKAALKYIEYKGLPPIQIEVKD